MDIDTPSEIVALSLLVPLSSFDFHLSQWLLLLKDLSRTLSLSILANSPQSHFHSPLSELHLFPVHFFSTPMSTLFLSHGYFQFIDHPPHFNVSHLHDLLSFLLPWIKFHIQSFYSLPSIDTQFPCPSQSLLDLTDKTRSLDNIDHWCSLELKIRVKENTTTLPDTIFN